MALTIRTAYLGDLAGLLALYRELHVDDPVLSHAVSQQTLQQIIESPWMHLIVASEGATTPLVATTYLNIIPNLTRGAQPYAVIENVVTLKDLRGRGVGQALMQHTLEFAWQQGCYKAMLQTGSKNPNTHQFYRRCGFTADDKTGYLARPPTT